MLKSRRRAFSLLEILIVMVVIAILSALFIYSYKNVRQQRELSVCGAKLRGAWTAMISYAVDNDGTLKSRMNGNTTTDSFWGGRLYKFKYISQQDEVICPVEPGTRDGNTWHWSTYGMNMFDPRGVEINTGDKDKGTNGKAWEIPISRVDNPESYVLFADSANSSASYQNARIRSGEPVHLKHLYKEELRANIIYLDGHLISTNLKQAEELINQYSLTGKKSGFPTILHQP